MNRRPTCFGAAGDSCAARHEYRRHGGEVFWAVQVEVFDDAALCEVALNVAFLVIIPTRRCLDRGVLELADLAMRFVLDPSAFGVFVALALALLVRQIVESLPRWGAVQRAVCPMLAATSVADNSVAPGNAFWRWRGLGCRFGRGCTGCC